jgi:hypothetical protein
MSIERKLAIVGVSAIALFLFAAANGWFDAQFGNSFKEKAFIFYVVACGVGPWLYLLEVSWGSVSRGRFAAYFLGSWLLAPYFLYLLAPRPEDESHAH